MRFIRSMIGSAAILCFLLSGCSKAPKKAAAADTKGQPETHGPKLHDPAPDFELKDNNGATARLADYKGKVLLLDFWATWCGPCKIEIPWFIEFQKQYKSRGFEVLGVSMDEGGWDEVKPYLAERGINYRVALGNDKVGQAYGGVDSLPTTFMIDRAGRIALVHVGLEKGKNELRDEIEGLLRDEPARCSALLFAPALVAGAR